MAESVLVLEFNELSPVLMDRFIAAGDLPNFARLRARSDTWTTDAEEPEGERLNPWVQWLTVHTGLAAEEHGALLLGERVELPTPTVADRVCAAGGTSVVFGSMNLPNPRPGFRGVFLPDPWSVGTTPQPAELRPFFDYVRTQVQEHTNVEGSRGGARPFLRFLATHGLRPATAAAVVAQLAGERTGRRGRWRRAMVLDRLQWDVFRWCHRRHRPTFATFFSNSTAHAQHLYWRDMDPTGFAEWTAEDAEGLPGAVRAGYQAMDRLVGEAFGLAGDAASIVLCTALSQQANLTGAMLDRECFHRPRDVSGFSVALGLDGVLEVAPVMAEEFHLYCRNDAVAEDVERTLRGATVAGTGAFAVRRAGTDVFVGCCVFTPLPADAELLVGDRRLRFHEIMYRSDSPRSGTHHPDGLLWIRTPGQTDHQERGRLPLSRVRDVLLALLPATR